MSIDPPSRPHRFFSRLERLPIFGLTVAVLFGSLFVKYIHDVDMYWQLEFGEIICRTGQWPSHEPFLHGKETVPNIPICWLSQVIFYRVWSLGGWPLLQIVEGALWIGGYAAVARALRRRGAWGWPAALALLYGFLPSYTFASIRPQSFALLGFGLTMVLTWAEMKLWKKLTLGAILFVVWQNAHPSVLMAGGWLGPMTAGAFVRWLRRPSSERGSFPWDLAGLSAAAIAAAFACPSALATFQLAEANGRMSKYLDVSEWMPLFWDALPWEDQYGLEGRGTTLFALAILAVLVTLRWRRMKPEELVTALIMAALTWQMYRFSVFLGLALIPVAYRALAPRPDAPAPPPLIRRWKMLLAIAFAIAIGICLGRFAIAELAAPQRTPLDPHMDYYPFEAVARMKETLPPGTIYCDFFWGGIVVRRNPQWKVSHDGRYYHFSQEEWDRYWSGMQQRHEVAHRAGLADILGTYRPVGFLLRVGFDDGLIAKLDAPDSGWIRVKDVQGRDSFDRGQAVVFMPRR